MGGGLGGGGGGGRGGVAVGRWWEVVVRVDSVVHGLSSPYRWCVSGVLVRAISC
jgi:hypothetical protein